MNLESKKLIVFKKDVMEKMGEKKYLKFLTDNKDLAMFYFPEQVPKYFDNELFNNNIEEVYEIESLEDLVKYQDKVYTLRKQNDVYDVKKGIELDKRWILPVNKCLNFKLNLPIYSYKLIDDVYYISDIIDNFEDNLCYVSNDYEISFELKKIMTPVVETIPGVLTTNDYPYKPMLKVKKRKKWLD